MRFFLLLITVAMVPLMVMLHAQFFTETQAPELKARLLASLQEQGITSAQVELDLLDAKISGTAQDADTAEKAHAAVSKAPVRIIEDSIQIPAQVQGTLSGTDITLSGWLPDTQNVKEITHLLQHLRPDLKVNTQDLRVHERVQKLPSEKITAQSSLLQPWLETLRQPPWLNVKRDAQGLHVSGLLSAGDAKTAVLKALDLKDAQALNESPFTTGSRLDQTAAVAELLKSFFHPSTLRELSFEPSGKMRLQAACTHAQAIEWQRLLQPLIGTEKPVLDLTYYVSEWHLPYRVLTSPLPAEQGRKLTALLTQHPLVFEAGSAELSGPQRSHLASLLPPLVVAGPAMKLALVTYAEKTGAETRELGQRRLEAVHTFLIEQGLSAREVEKVVIEATLPSTSGKSATPGTVEILLR